MLAALLSITIGPAHRECHIHGMRPEATPPGDIVERRQILKLTVSVLGGQPHPTRLHTRWDDSGTLKGIVRERNQVGPWIGS